MNFDPSQFARVSIVDTCALWNMLSSLRISEAAFRAKLSFCTTQAVLYECLHKQRSATSPEQEILKQRLKFNRERGNFPIQECSLDDLIEVSERAPGRLGSGELSCIAAAYRIRSIAVMTDERLARKYAQNTLGLAVETTPRLYGYLHFHMLLSDVDHNDVIKEHETFEKRPLTEFFNITYREATRCRLIAYSTNTPANNNSRQNQ